MMARVKITFDRHTGEKIAEETEEMSGDGRELIDRAAQILYQPVIQSIEEKRSPAKAG